ncbi:response regulator transcription factor [Methylicorpusculum sp.]|uniref:response regulator transcription factor n=1 Tax=Methylicorpusculum sp. TaxID=2713644 RepID=UPI0027175A67|nr:response regulator transcription factor [Methylicorpusculum sp.]MDO8845175.1 response regulator transcription factor [Methylicorpusculum sp.]
MIRLIIADDHPIIRTGLKHLFQLSVDIDIVAETDNSQQLLDLLKDKVDEVDLLLLDLNMPGFSGIESITYVRKHYPDLPILILSMHNELQIVTRALKAGASGYLTKDSEPEILLSAIRKVAAGGRFIDPKLAEKLVFEFEGSHEKKPHEKLSEREFEVMQLLANGKSVNEIANALFISNKTVSTHKTHLLKKLHLNNITELIRYFDAQDWHK